MKDLTSSNYRLGLITAFFCLLIPALQGCHNQTPIYKPGTYFNEASGYHSTLLIQVTVNKYNIEEIIVLEHEEPEILADIVFKELPPRMIKKNTAEVDIVSGASYTSQALITAVDLALRQAKEALE